MSSAGTLRLVVGQRRCDSDDPHGFSLVHRVQQGDESAFGELFLRFRPHVRAALGRMLRDADADELTQEAFMRARQSLEGFDVNRPTTPLGWLLTIARNLALDSLRLGETTAAWDPLEVTVHCDAREWAPDPHAEFEGRASMRELVARLKALPQSQRQALVMVQLDGRSYEEAARSMGTTAVNVRQLKSRATKKVDRRTVGRGVGQRRSSPMLIRLKPLPVIGSRRWALWGTDARSAFAHSR